MQIISALFAGSVIRFDHGSDCRKTLKVPVYWLIMTFNYLILIRIKKTKHCIETFSTVSQASRYISYTR